MPDKLVMLSAGLFMISFLVLIHEAGHFFVARLFRVAVPVFSVFVGPTVAAVRWGGTVFRLGLIPLGGYVQMAGADPFGEEDADDAVDPAVSFTHKPVWQRLLIMAAGPAVNLALPFFLFTALLMMGRPDLEARVLAVLPGTPAAAAGFQIGDAVVAVDGEPVVIWYDLMDRVAERVGAVEPVRFTVERGGAELTLEVPGAAFGLTPAGEADMNRLGARGVYLSSRVGVDDPASPAGRAGLRSGDFIRTIDGQEVQDWHEVLARLNGATHTVGYARQRGESAEVDEGEVVLTADPTWAAPERPFANRWGVAPVMLFALKIQEGSAAEAAGLLSGDRLLRADGDPILTFDQFIDQVARTRDGTGAPREMTLEVVRGGQVVAIPLTPRVQLASGEAWERPVVGMTTWAESVRGGATVRKYYGIAEAVPRAVEESMAIISGTASMIRNVLTVKSDVRENVGGPVAIFYAAGVVAEEGFFEYATLIGMISVSLGLVNLLPIPVLDGGQILFFLVELIRGRPLSIELREKVQIVSVLGLAITMLLVIVNDISRIVVL
jgi:regulator of sigma E protease